ncbi:hypothetical protein TIFTF001_026830 [Ficus carica]|uniref:Uncharacterized protein n=1 Tax=Ficus carica TaxID=3494 RepID=A0AA88IZ97_FICCA|nr:hypothetical protein TIFTF001_026830 [Ficus carica]
MPHNLPTLDVSGSLVWELPVKIKKLRKLRYLIAYWTANKSRGRDLVLEQGVRIHEGIGRLEELQTLMVVAADPNRAGFIKELETVREFLNWIVKLQNLQGLSLYLSRLIDEPLKYLKSSFQKLVQLGLRQFKGLKVVKIDRGALSLLEKLDMGPFPQMREIVPNIQHLTTLKSLDFTDMPREFAAGLQPYGGPNYWKIQHVSSVKFWYKDDGTTYDIYKLKFAADSARES